MAALLISLIPSLATGSLGGIVLGLAGHSAGAAGTVKRIRKLVRLLEAVKPKLSDQEQLELAACLKEAERDLPTGMFYR